jgi:hypothetical protein
MKITAKLIVIVCLLSPNIACQKHIDKNEIIGTVTETDSTSVASAVVGINGGIIKFDDNTTLKVPSQSLNKDVKITITRVKNSSLNDTLERELLLLGPEGTIFSKPAKLTLSYANLQLKNSNSIEVFTCSNGVWERLSISDIDKKNKQVEIEIAHFSILLLKERLDLYLTVDIPGQFLKKGDLIYALALTTGYEDFYWFPGHAALYLGTNNPNDNSNDGQTIIESSPDKVQFNTLSTFINASYHLFMGARRYDGSISYNQRTQIATFGINQLDKPYSLVGQDIQSNSFSCVGLTEAAYESTTPQLNIIPEVLEIPWSLPYDQFARTKPIDEITVKSGEIIFIKVYGVIWDDLEGYLKTLDGVGIINLPSGANWTKSDDCWIFSWQPKESDVYANYNVTFRVQKAIPGGGIEQQSQTIVFKVGPADLSFLNEGLIAYYPFNGNSSDNTQNGNHGVVNGPTLTTDRFDNLNSAYSFDGIDDYIRVPYSPVFRLDFPYTIMAWIYPISITDDPNSYNVILCQSEIWDEIYSLGISPGTIWSGHRGQGNINFKIPLNKWALITTSFSKNMLIYAYNDNILYNGPTDNLGAIINGISSHDVFIGKDENNFNHVFSGKIDEIRFYNRAVSADEIKYIYQLQKNK